MTRRASPVSRPCPPRRPVSRRQPARSPAGWLRRLTTALATLLWLSGGAQAQAPTEHRMYVVTTTVENARWVMHLYEGLLQDGHLVSFVGRTTVDGRSAHSLFDPGRGSIAVLAGGDVVAWRGHETRDTQNVLVYNRRSDTLTFLPGLDDLGVPDPVHPRLFSPYQGSIAVVSEAGLQALPNTTGLLPRALSADGSRLYTVRPEYSDRNVSRVVVVDTATGATLDDKALPRTYSQVSEIVVSPDATRLWLLVTQGDESWIVGIDVASGAEVLTIPLRSSFASLAPSGLALDGAGRLVVSVLGRPQVIYPTSFGALHVFDASTGTDLQATPLAGRAHLRVDAPTSTALTLSYSEYWAGFSSGCGTSSLTVLSTAPGGAPIVTPLGDLGCAVAAFSENVSTALLPPSLSAPSVDATRAVSLSWTAPPGPVSGYLVEAGSAPGLSDIGTIPITSTSLVVPGVPPGTYYLRVRAQNAGSTSLPSNEQRLDVTSAPVSPPVLDPPVVAADATVTLSWTRPPGATAFVLEAGTAPGLSDIASLDVGGVDRLTLPGVPEGRYFVRVRAAGAAGAGPPSNEVQVLVMAPAPPGAPTFDVPIVGTGGTVTLSWQPPSGSVTGFVVEVGSAPGLVDLATLQVPRVFTLTVPGVPGGSYFVRVRALNGQVAGLPSAERRIDVPAAAAADLASDTVPTRLSW